MHLRSSSNLAIVVSLLAEDVMTVVNGGHHHHHKCTDVDITIIDDVLRTMTETIFVTVSWPGGETIGIEYPIHWPSLVSTTSLLFTLSATLSIAPSIAPTQALVFAESVGPSATIVAISASSSSAPPTTMPALEVGAATRAGINSTTIASSSSSGGSTKKRGLAYNIAPLTDAFDGDNSLVSWAYNWGSSSSGLTSPFEYIPMLWSNQADKTGPWNAAASTAIASGTTHLFSFNEPDIGGQANMDYYTAASAFVTYMEPFAQKAKLGAPAVTNSVGNNMGLTYLSNFLGACSSCTIDFINIHWYSSASNFANFKNHVQDAHGAGGGRPVWITEFGASGSADEQKAFLEVVIPWLDAQDYIERYAYFMCADGILLSGTSLNALGSTFKSFSSKTISSLIA